MNARTAWAAIDADNIRRRSIGLSVVRLPSNYSTNEVPTAGGFSWMAGAEHDALPALLEMLEHLGVEHRNDAELTTAALLNMLHRHLTNNQRQCVPFVNEKLNERMGVNRYLFEAVDHLISKVRESLATSRE